MKELLVPVGSMDALVVAINSGADAVYLGGKKFGARAYATNFDDEEMVRAIKLCHLYGVKIYVTVNTLTFESELSSVYEYALFLHQNGVDAIIVQDIGLIKYLRKRLPNLEIHASTQCHNTNNAGVKYLKNLGVSRVVMARELSIDEINNIDTDLEIEAFIHGALCVSYSGECLMSSFLLDRSGNRGKCAQVCRLPYKMYEDDKLIETDGDYLLSTKELNTSNVFDSIMKSNIYSLKIEGRMKGLEYTGCVTKLYRELIDSYNETGTSKVNMETLKDLTTIFNRKFTNGLLFKSTNEELMNIKTSNHVGVPLGKVVDVDKKYIYIKLDDNLNQGDGIRFVNINEGMICNFIYSKNTKLINKASAGEVVLVDNKFKVRVGDIVNKTLDINIQNKYINVPQKRINVDMTIDARINSPIKLTISDGRNLVTREFGMVEEARNMGMDNDSIRKQLSKLGNTPFILNNIDFNVDNNIFINIKDLNEIRRMCVDELITIRENTKKEVIINDYKSVYNLPYKNELTVSVLVRNEEQYRAAEASNVDRIIIENKHLFNEHKDNTKVIYRTSRVGDTYNNPSYVTELGAITNGGIGDYYLNITNHETINEFSSYLDVVTLSPELDNEEVSNIMNYYDNKLNAEVLIYSYIELMLLKYCPVNLNVNKDKVCTACSKDHKYYLADRFDKKYRLLMELPKHITHVMHYKPIRKFEDVSLYKSLGINNYRIEFLDEDYDECINIINELKTNL